MATIELRRADDGTISYRAKVRLKGHPTEYVLNHNENWAIFGVDHTEN